MADLVKEVLRGRVEDVPSLSFDVVRLYICSTFTDMEVERMYLMKNIYPRLHQYCQESYALEFQPIDLRMGRSCLEADDHNTLQLCLDEIRLCQQLSVGPSFALLLGQKYGTVMLPREIDDDEFAALRKSMQGSDREFLDTWYIKDTNASPPVYVLQPRYSRQGIIWVLVESKLRDLLQEAALVCVANQMLTDDQTRRYFHSSLEQEVSQGILNNPNADTQCLLFTRSMNNVNPDHRNASNFVDLSNDEIDPLAQRQLLELVDQKLFEKLVAYNIYQYENLEWSDSGTGGINETDHGEYLRDLGEDFELAVKRLIDQAMLNRPEKSETDLYRDCVQQCELVKENSAMFWGRKEELKQIEDYVNDGLSGHPLVLYGHSGSGKTTIVAKAAEMMYKGWRQNKDKTYQIVRFIGKTPSTSEINPLLRSLVQHIVTLLAEETSLPTEVNNIPIVFEELAGLFKSILKYVPKDKKLVIFLDGLDEIMRSDNAFSLSWLPLNLRLNVKIVVTVLDQGQKFIDTLHQRDFPIINFVNISELGAQSSLALLRHWVCCHERNLTLHQWKSLMMTLGRKTHSPLYLRLLLDDILQWHSYDKTYLRSPPKDVSACIRVLFEKLKETHGAVLVTHAFCLLVVSKYGLSQRDLVDILSLDDEVLQNYYYNKILPEIQRLPVIAWAALQRDAKYLMCVEAQGSRVLLWKHRSFLEAIEILYLKIRTDNEETFLQLVVDYFIGTYATTPKLLRINVQSKSRNSKKLEMLGMRFVPKQVNMFATKSQVEGKKYDLHFNYRKLAEVPAALIALSAIQNFNHDALKRLAKMVIFNYEMLYAYLKCGRAEDYLAAITGHWIHDPINNQSEDFIKRELYMIARYFTDHYRYIVDNPDCAGSFLASKLLPFYGYLPHITRFIDKVDSVGRSTCALVPTCQQGSSSLSLAHCTISNPTDHVVDVVITGKFIYSLSTKLVAVYYSQSNCRVVYSTPLRIAENDKFQLLTAGKREWTAKYFPSDQNKKTGSTDTCEKILLYAALQGRPHVYIIDSSTGDILQIIKCDEICRELISHRIMLVHVVGDPRTIEHLLCVVMHSGAVIIIDIASKQLVWKDLRGKPIIGSVDSGYRNAVQVLGLFQTTGEIMWMCWTKLDECFRDKSRLSPKVAICELSKTSTEVLTSVQVTGRVLDEQKNDTVHAVFANNHGGIIYAWNILRIKIMNGEQAITLENIIGKKMQSISTLPTRSMITLIACDKSCYKTEYGQVFVICGTETRTFVLGFHENDPYGSILFTISSTFDSVVLEQYVFYVVSEGTVSMFEYLEDPFRLFTYGSVDEQRGRINRLFASEGGYLFATCHGEGGVCLYRSDILVLMGRRTSTLEKNAVQQRIGTVQCSYSFAATLSHDKRCLAVWDVQNCILKRELTFTQPVEQFRFSESETHVAAVTSGGKLLLYIVENVDDLPDEPILQLQLKTTDGNCWLTTVRSQPGSICIITEIGAVTTINVETCQILHDSKTQMPANIDDVICRNDNIYIIYHGRRTFLALHPISGQATWELDMDSKTGKSLQKFGDAILDIAEYDDSVYALLTSIDSSSLVLNLLCVKPHSNSIFKILDLTLPRSVQFVCAYGNSRHIIYHHNNWVEVIDMSKNCVKMKEELTYPKITSDGQYLVGVHNDRYLKLFRLSDTSCIAAYKLSTDIEGVEVSADDEYVIAVGKDRKMYSFALADPQQSVHTLTIKKLPSRSHAPLNALETYREDPRYQTLRDMTQVLEEGFPQMLDIDADEVKNEPLEQKSDSPLRMGASNGPKNVPTYKPFILSYGHANLQSTTNKRLQKVKSRFVEVDVNQNNHSRGNRDAFSNSTGNRASISCLSTSTVASAATTNGGGPRSMTSSAVINRRRHLMTLMNRGTSARRGVSLTSNLSHSASLEKSRASLAYTKHMQLALRREEAVSPTKSLSMSRTRGRPTSNMSKTCVIS